MRERRNVCCFCHPHHASLLHAYSWVVVRCGIASVAVGIAQLPFSCNILSLCYFVCAAVQQHMLNHFLIAFDASGNCRVPKLLTPPILKDIIASTVRQLRREKEQTSSPTADASQSTTASAKSKKKSKNFQDDTPDTTTPTTTTSDLTNDEFLISYEHYRGMVGASQWAKSGLQVPELGNQKIFPAYNVFLPK